MSVFTSLIVAAENFTDHISLVITLVGCLAKGGYLKPSLFQGLRRL